MAEFILIAMLSIYFLIGLAAVLLDDNFANLSFKNKILYLFIWPIVGI